MNKGEVLGDSLQRFEKAEQRIPSKYIRRTELARRPIPILRKLEDDNDGKAPKRGIEVAPESRCILDPRRKND